MHARYSQVLWMSCLTSVMLTSCAAPGARAGRDADSSVAGIRTEIDRLDAALLSIRSEMHAGRDVNQNDKWTLRLLGFAVMLLGLSYPVGKIIWICLTGLRSSSRAASATDASELMTPFSVPKPRAHPPDIDVFGQHRPAASSRK